MTIKATSLMLNLRADWLDGQFGRTSVAEMLCESKQFQGKRKSLNTVSEITDTGPMALLYMFGTLYMQLL